jgi:hypothetical protein
LRDQWEWSSWWALLLRACHRISTGAVFFTMFDAHFMVEPILAVDGRYCLVVAAEAKNIS